MRVKRKALRRGVWFKALDGLERSFINLTCTILKKIVSITMVRQIMDIMLKLKDAMREHLPLQTVKRKVNMPQILDASILEEREKVLSYGGMGSGKTFAAGTMPGRVYFLAIGGANEFKTLLSPDFRGKHPEKDGLFTFDAVKEKLGKRGTFTESFGYDAACDALDEALNLDLSGDMPFDSLVVDGATGLRGVAMNKSMEITYTTAKSSDKTSMKKYRDHGIAIPQDNDWYGEQSLIWKFVNWCFSLDKHFNLITHEWREVKKNRADRSETLVSLKPAFTGKQRDDIPTLFDNVWHFEVHGGERSRYYEAQTQRDDIVEARTRFGGVVDTMYRNVDYAETIKKFQQAAVA